MPLPTVTATRYVAPLREGGSMPALVEADDLGLYVVKLSGAGQGPGALAAEIIGGELARRLGLRVPDLALVDVDPALGVAEPDPEIQDLLKWSPGLNAGLDFLPGSLMYQPGAGTPPPPEEAAAVVWLDALLQNVDRTASNPNLLRWHGDVWLIDHGAALFRQHGTDDLAAAATSAFPMVAQHVLLDAAGSIEEADARLADRARAAVDEVVALVPEAWVRGDYAGFLHGRLAGERGFVAEAETARRAAIARG